jgi:hypothetical protein
MSNKIDPSYLRYIHDGLNSGSIHAENASSLPEGLTGLYEATFLGELNVKESQQLLTRFTYFSLLKKEVSCQFVAIALNEPESEIVDFISNYSKWFNSAQSGKYSIYHERLRTYILSAISQNEFEVINNRIISLSQNALVNRSNDEWEYYALEYLSNHLFVESMISGNGDILKEIAYDTAHWNRQIEISKGFEWSKKMLNEMMHWAAKYDDEEVIECALNKVDLHHMEQNDAPRIVELVANNDIETALQRIEAFGGNDKEGLQRKFILYMLCLMELTLLESKDKPFRKEAIEKLLRHLDANIPEDHYLFNWSLFFSEFLIFIITKQLVLDNVDYSLIYKRTQGWSGNWIRSINDYNRKYPSLFKTNDILIIEPTTYKLLFPLNINNAESGTLIENVYNYFLSIEAFEIVLNMFQKGFYTDNSLILLIEKCHNSELLNKNSDDILAKITNLKDEAICLYIEICIKNKDIKKSENILSGITDPYYIDKANYFLCKYYAEKQQFEKVETILFDISDLVWKSNVLMLVAKNLILGGNKEKSIELIVSTVEPFLIQQLKIQDDIIDFQQVSSAYFQILSFLHEHGEIEIFSAYKNDYLGYITSSKSEEQKSLWLKDFTIFLINLGEYKIANALLDGGNFKSKIIVVEHRYKCYSFYLKTLSEKNLLDIAYDLIQKIPYKFEDDDSYRYYILALIRNGKIINVTDILEKNNLVREKHLAFIIEELLLLGKYADIERLLPFISGLLLPERLSFILSYCDFLNEDNNYSEKTDLWIIQNNFKNIFLELITSLQINHGYSEYKPQELIDYFFNRKDFKQINLISQLGLETHFQKKNIINHFLIEKKWEEAINWCRKDIILLNFLYQYFKNDNLYEFSKKVLDEIISINDTQSQYFIANCLLDFNKIEEAEAICKRELDKAHFENNIEKIIQYAFVLLKIGYQNEFDKIITNLKTKIINWEKEVSGNWETSVQKGLDCAYCCKQQNDEKKSAQFITLVIEKIPNNSDATVLQSYFKLLKMSIALNLNDLTDVFFDEIPFFIRDCNDDFWACNFFVELAIEAKKNRYDNKAKSFINEAYVYYMLNVCSNHDEILLKGIILKVFELDEVEQAIDMCRHLNSNVIRNSTFKGLVELALQKKNLELATDITFNNIININEVGFDEIILENKSYFNDCIEQICKSSIDQGNFNLLDNLVVKLEKKQKDEVYLLTAKTLLDKGEESNAISYLVKIIYETKRNEFGYFYGYKLSNKVLMRDQLIGIVKKMKTENKIEILNGYINNIHFYKIDQSIYTYMIHYFRNDNNMLALLTQKVMLLNLLNDGEFSKKKISWSKRPEWKWVNKFIEK